ncbi:hypothetical protein M434DRAFT_397559 [Hypoxylon sp. CO27-5]|nr:hypothetical protein M434DRAFT_397559 [Hypoxylon sp. CO27-5]
MCEIEICAASCLSRDNSFVISFPSLFRRPSSTGWHSKTKDSSGQREEPGVGRCGGRDDKKEAFLILYMAYPLAELIATWCMNDFVMALDRSC